MQYKCFSTFLFIANCLLNITLRSQYGYPQCSTFLTQLATHLIPTSYRGVLSHDSCPIIKAYAQVLSKREMLRMVGPMNGDWHYAAHLLGALMVDRDCSEDVLDLVLYVQAKHQLHGTDSNWGLCWPSLEHGMIWRSMHLHNLSGWQPLAVRWCSFSRMRSQNYSITILGQCWHGVGHGVFHATVMTVLSGIRFPCESPQPYALNESWSTPYLLEAYDECARHCPTRFAELWCANGVGHDAYQYVSFISHDVCIHVSSFATSASCFRYMLNSESIFSNSMVRCHALFRTGLVRRGCVFAVASVAREKSSMCLSDCTTAVSGTLLAEVPGALLACAAGLQFDCSHAVSCRPMTWDILVTSHRTRISALAQAEEALDPHPWPMLAR